MSYLRELGRGEGRKESFQEGVLSSVKLSIEHMKNKTKTFEEKEPKYLPLNEYGM